ncbi:MAG: glucan-binding YG repeat protein [Planctomycetota bacterium]|jgi:glucan-binding YG repeat protein
MFRFALIAAFLIVSFSWTTSAMADEIKLKSGETIKDCKVKKKGKSKWTVILLDGSRKSIPASDIESHVEKPTLGDALDARLKKAGKKNKDALLQIGRDAMAAGAKKQGVKALKLVARLDKNNLEAHQLLGDVKCEDGKWRNGRALEKYRNAAREAELKAKGWSKVKGEWVDPLTAQNIKDGLVKHDGKWYTKKHAANLKAGQIFMQGTWYGPGDKAKLDDGMLKYKGKWGKVRDINSKMKENGDSWRLVGDHFIVIGPQGRKNLLICLQHLDSTWEAMAEIYGQASPTTKEDDKVTVYVAKDAQGYKDAFHQNGGDDRCSYFSSAFGGAFASKSGAVVTYYYNVGYLVQFTQQAGACAFQAKLLGYENCPSNFYDAFACYIQGFSGGRYRAFSEMSFNGFRDWKKPGDPFAQFIDYDLSTSYPTGAKNEQRFARMGFLIHYLREKHPDVLNEWVKMVFAKKGDTKSLVAKAKSMLKDVDVEKEFAKFLQQFVATYQEPKIKLSAK